MLKFDFITDLIHALLKEEGIKDLPLNHVRKLIKFRNKYLDINKDDSFNWIKLPKRKNTQWIKDELEYRKNVCLFIKEKFKRKSLITPLAPSLSVEKAGDEFKKNKYKEIPKKNNIQITDEIIDKVFSIENFILVDVGNIRSYYEMLDILKKKDISFVYLCEIKKWTSWKKTVDQAIDFFIYVYGLYPNAMIANKHTFSQINFIVSNVPADRSKILDFDEKTLKIKPVEKHKEINLVGIRSHDFFLRFIPDDEMPDKKFMLYYHDGPFLNWDDDDDDDDDKVKPVPITPLSQNVFIFS
jgi:hypothetical protein